MTKAMNLRADIKDILFNLYLGESTELDGYKRLVKSVINTVMVGLLALLLGFIFKGHIGH